MWVSENRKHKLLREFYDKINREKDKAQPKLLLSEFTCALPLTDTRKLTQIENLFLDDRFLPALHPKEVSGVFLLDCDLSALQLSDTTITDLFILGHNSNRQFLGDYVTSIDRSFKQTEEVDLSNEGFFSRISTFHRSIEIDKEIVVELDDFGENRQIPKSRADGLFLNNAVIDGCVIFMRGSARGVMAENLNIKGDLIFDAVPLDFTRLTDFKIGPKGLLCILNSINYGRFKIADAIISTSHKLSGNLAFSHIEFVNTNFSTGDQTAYLRLSQLNDVIFKECNFANVNLSQSIPTDFIWRFDSCDLSDTRFENLRGELNIDHNIADFTIENSEVALKFNTADIKLHLNDVIVVNPEIKTHLKSKEGKWNKVTVRVDDNRSASMAGCVLENIDLSDPDSVFKVSGSLDLSKTIFRNCNLSGISFKNCILNDAVFDNCNLTRCSFGGAKEPVKNLTLKGAETRLDDVSFADKFKNLILENISSREIAKADFAEGEFICGEFRAVKFQGWQARNARFLGVRFIDCQFIDCHLEGCLFDAFAGQPTELFNCDFTTQKIIREVTFNDVVIKKDPQRENSFKGVQFQQCRIESAAFFVNDTKSDTFSETTWIKCDFLPGLDMSDFPFSRISIFEDIKLSECLLRKLTINCSLRRVVFAGCELSKVNFGSPSCRAFLENIEIQLLPPKSSQSQPLSSLVNKIGTFVGVHLPFQGKSQQIHFTNARISDLKIESNITTSDKPEFSLKIEPDVEIDKLKLVNLNLNNFSLSSNRVIKSLLCNGVNVVKGSLSGGTLQEARFERFQAENFDLTGVRFTDDCSFTACSLQKTKIENSNFFSLPAAVFNDVKISSATIKTAISGDFSQYHNSGLKISDSTFQECDFSGAKLQDFNFSNNRLLHSCNLSQIKEGKISGCDFSAAGLQSSLDNLTLERCVLAKTDFTTKTHGEKQIFKKVLFKECRFDPQTNFTGVVFQGDEQRPELFCDCQGITTLNLDRVVLSELSLRNCTFSGKIYVEFSNCIMDDITFDQADIELKLFDVISNTLTFQSLTVKEKCGLIIDGQTGLAAIRKMSFIKCKIQQMDIENAAFSRVEFKKCEQSQDIIFTQCSFMDRIRFIRGHSENEENEILIDGFSLFSCYFPQRGRQTASLDPGHPFLEFIDNYSSEEIGKFEISYYSEKLFSKKLRNELHQLGINPGQHIGKEWGAPLPFINYVQEIKKLMEEGKTGEIRHENPKHDFDNLLSGFKEFRDRLPFQNYLFSPNAKDKIMKRTQHLIDALDAKGADIDLDEYLQFKNQWESLMLIRVDDEELAALEGRSSFKPWLLESLTGCDCEILTWPLIESGKLYLDFVCFRELLSRIAQNIVRYSSEKTVGIHAAIDTHKVLTLFIGDRGPGWRISDSTQLTNVEIGKLYRNFAAQYTLEAYLRCNNAEGNPRCLKAESFFYADYPLTKTDFEEWYGDGTIYVLKFQLF